MNPIGVQIVEDVFCFVSYKEVEIEEIPNTKFFDLSECEDVVRRLVDEELLTPGSVPALLREAKKKMLDRERKRKKRRERQLILAQAVAEQRQNGRKFFPRGRS